MRDFSDVSGEIVEMLSSPVSAYSLEGAPRRPVDGLDVRVEEIDQSRLSPFDLSSSVD